MKHFKAIGCFLLLVANPAHALTGLELYQSCIGAKDGAPDIACLSYVRGFIDGMAFGGPAGPYFCPPKDGIAADQGRLVAEKYLRDHPDSLYVEAGLLLGAAFLKAFPCEPKP